MFPKKQNKPSTFFLHPSQNYHSRRETTIQHNIEDNSSYITCFLFISFS